MLKNLMLAVSCVFASAPTVQSIDALEAEGLRRNGFAVIVDVREVDERAEGYVPGSRHVPFSAIQAGAPEWKSFVSGLKSSEQVVFYCQSGGRSRAAGQALLALKPSAKVRNLGGIDAWTRAKLGLQR